MSSNLANARSGALWRSRAGQMIVVAIMIAAMPIATGASPVGASPDNWTQTSWSGVKVKPTAQVGQWGSMYDNYYDSENVDVSDNENVKLLGQPASAWVSLAPIPGYGAGVSSALADNGGIRYVYALRGGTSTTFYRYRTDTNTWETMASTPAAVGDGGSLAYAENGGISYLYALQGRLQTTFYRYRIDNNTWETMTSTLATVGRGGSLAYAENNGIGYLHALRGNSTAHFYRYRIDTDTWENMAPIPAAVGDGGALVYAENGGVSYIYAFRGGAQTGFYRYRVSDNAWDYNNFAPATVDDGGSLARVGKFIYAARGYSTDVFRYSIVENKWSSVVGFPAAVTTNNGGRLVFDNVDNYLYMIRGATDCSFWRATLASDNSISGGVWVNRADVPGYGAGISSALADNGGIRYLYALQGGGSAFHRYRIDTDTWETMASTPAAVGDGGSLAYAENGGISYLYALRGGLQTTFYRYRIDTNTWESMATTSATIDDGGSLAHAENGGENYLYALRGNASTTFYRYKISTNSWETMTAAPAAVDDGGSLEYVEVGGVKYLYALRGNASAAFYRYRVDTDTWETLADTPATIGIGAGLVWVGQFLYCARGNNSSYVFRYSISGNTWSTTVFPGTVGTNNGGRLVFDNVDNYLYMIRGATDCSFWRATLASDNSISGGAWVNRADIPLSNMGNGISSTIAENAGIRYIYVLQGGGASGFYRYRIDNNTWETMASTPAVIDAGGALAYAENGGIKYAYALRGGTTTDFYRYRTDTNAWEAMASTPATIDSGGSLAYAENGGVGYLYALRGGAYTTFYRYRIDNNTWETMASTPAGIGAGGSLAYYTDPTGINYLYALRGGTTTDFYRYRIDTNAWETMANVLSTVVGGGSLAQAGRFLYAARGSSTSTVYRYSIGDLAWFEITGFPDTVTNMGNKMVYDYRTNTIYMIHGDPDSSLWRMTLTSSPYVLVTRFTGSLTSSVHDSGNAGTKWDNISWSSTTPSLTSVELWVRFDNALGSDNQPTSTWENATSNPFTFIGKFARYMQYQARLRTDNAKNTPVLTSLTINYTPPPSPPTLSSPVSGENTIDNTPTFQWTVGSGADNHRLLVDNDNDLSSPIDNQMLGAAATSWTKSDPGYAEGVYYWKVIAINSAGENSSENRSFRVDITRPAAPTITAPADGENTNDNTPAITWGAVSENSQPVLYRVVIDNNSDFSSPENDSGWISTTTYTSGYLSDNLYYLRVGAKDNAGNIGDNSQRTFRVDTTRPAAPAPVSPVDGENTNDNTPTLNWNTVSDNSIPILYRVWVDNDSDFGSPENDSGWITANSHTPGTLAEKVYYWRVGAKDNAGNLSDNSSSRSLRVDITAPSAPTLVSPENNSTVGDTTPTFVWTTVTDPSGAIYDIMVDDEASFSSPYTYSKTGISTNYQTSENVFALATYYWRVRAKDNAGNTGTWADNFKFTLSTGAAPGQPTLSSPANGENTNDNTPTFQWIIGSAADNHNLVVDNDSDFSSILDNQMVGAAATSLTKTGAGYAEGVYYWKVIAINSVGENSSETRSFRVDITRPAAPALVSLVDGDNTNDNTPTLDWNTVSDNSLPILYRVYLDDDPTFASFDRDSGWISADQWDVWPILTEGVWYWRVGAMDNAGNVGDNSVSRSFRVDKTRPTAPTLVSPVDGENTNDNTPLLDWAAVSDSSLPVRYQVYVDNDPNFSYPIWRSLAWTAENSWMDNWEVGPPLNEGMYYWCVQARDNAGNIGDNSIVRSFRVDITAPPAPTLVSPDNDAQVGTTPTFDWSDVSDASGVKYTLELIGSLTKSGLSASTYGLAGSEALGAGTYQWRVQAVDNAGNTGAWSSTQTLRVVVPSPPPPSPPDTTPPTKPTLLSPVNGAMTDDTTPTFDWSDVSDASSVTYTLEIVGTLTRTGLSASTYTLTGSEALPAGTYQWRVQAIDSSNNASEWSDNWQLVIRLPPALESPADGTSTNDSTPTFKWSKVEWAATYKLQYARDNEFTSGVTERSLTVTSYTVLSGEALADNVWYWRVLPTDDAGVAGYWSSTWRFTVDATPPAPPQVDQLPWQTTAEILPVTGTVEENSVVMVYIDGILVGQTVAGADGKFQVSIILPEGSNVITLVAVDNAGNVGQSSQAQTVIYVKFVKALMETDFIEAGQSHTFDFAEYDLAVLSATVTVRENVIGPSISIETVENAENMSQPPGIIYGAVIYVVSNISTEDVEDVELHFAVEKSWIENNNIDVGKVRMIMYGSEWRDLPTSFVGEDENYMYFASQVELFGNFPLAIVGEEISVAPPVAAPLPALPLAVGTVFAITISGLLIYLLKFRPIPPAVPIKLFKPAPISTPEVPLEGLRPEPIHVPRPPTRRAIFLGCLRRAVKPPIKPAIPLERLRQVAKPEVELAIPLERLREEVLAKKKRK